MTEKLSIKITNMSLLMSILVVVIHSTTVVLNLPGTQISAYGKNADTFLQLFCSEGICRIAVPMFFIISGYLLFRNYDNTLTGYTQKLKRRFFSLVLPYLFWSGAVFFTFFILQKVPGLKEYFSTRQAVNLGFNTILHNIIFESYNSPLWFCRYLITFAVLAPLISILSNKKIGYMTLVVLFLLWLGVGNGIPGIRSDALFFYFFGAFLGKHNIQISNRLIRGGILISTVIWFVLLALRTYYLCGVDKSVLLNGEYDCFLDYSMKVLIIAGLFAVWFGYNYLPESLQHHRWSGVSFAFLIFVMHHPLAAALRKLFGKLFGSGTLLPTVNFLLTIIITITLVVLFGKTLKKLTPKFYMIIVGNR